MRGVTRFAVRAGEIQAKYIRLKCPVPLENKHGKTALQLCICVAAPLSPQEAGLVAVAWKPPSSQDARSSLNLQA